MIIPLPFALTYGKGRMKKSESKQKTAAYEVVVNVNVIQISN